MSACQRHHDDGNVRKVLGCGVKNWKLSELRSIMRHYQEPFCPRATKLELMGVLHRLSLERNLSRADRQAFLTAWRTSSPLPLPKPRQRIDTFSIIGSHEYKASSQKVKIRSQRMKQVTRGAKTRLQGTSQRVITRSRNANTMDGIEQLNGPDGIIERRDYWSGFDAEGNGEIGIGDQIQPPRENVLRSSNLPTQGALIPILRRWKYPTHLAFQHAPAAWWPRRLNAQSAWIIATPINFPRAESRSLASMSQMFVSAALINQSLYSSRARSGTRFLALAVASNSNLKTLDYMATLLSSNGSNPLSLLTLAASASSHPRRAVTDNNITGMTGFPLRPAFPAANFSPADSPIVSFVSYASRTKIAIWFVTHAAAPHAFPAMLFGTQGFLARKIKKSVPRLWQLAIWKKLLQRNISGRIPNSVLIAKSEEQRLLDVITWHVIVSAIRQAK